MLRIVGDCWRIAVWWYSSTRFKARWKQIYRTATSVPSVDGLYLSVCADVDRSRVVSSLERVWTRIPDGVRKELQTKWAQLQRRWDQRQVGIPLHVPVFGVFKWPWETVPDHGQLIGLAARAARWNGFADSGESLMRMFHLLFLPAVWQSDLTLPDEYLDLEVARCLASYYLCVKHSTRIFEGRHEGTDDLVAEWGFPIEQYIRWREDRLVNSNADERK